MEDKSPPPGLSMTNVNAARPKVGFPPFAAILQISACFVPGLLAA
jgi:hypothetical protein